MSILDNRKLTPEQCQIAISNISLVNKYMRRNNLYGENYYDAALNGYLRAVVIYTERQDLQKYAFSTICWNCMRSSVYNYGVYCRRKKRNYAVSSLDYVYEIDNGYTLMDLIGSSQYEVEDACIDNILMEQIYSMLNTEEIQVLDKLLSGASKNSIAKEYKWSRGKLEKLIQGIRELTEGLFENRPLA